MMMIIHWPMEMVKEKRRKRNIAPHSTYIKNEMLTSCDGGMDDVWWYWDGMDLIFVCLIY